MHNLGKKRANYDMLSVESKNEVYYPSFSVTEKQLPGIGKHGMDTTISLRISVKVKGIYQRDEKPKDYTLEVQKAGFNK